MPRQYSRTIALIVGALAALGPPAASVVSPDATRLLNQIPGLRILLWIIVFLSILFAFVEFARKHLGPLETPTREDDATRIDYQNRRVLLGMVRRVLIDGVLHRSLWHEMRLTLNLAGSPNKIVRHCDLMLRRAGQPDTYIQPGTPVFEIYRHEEGELLLLGEPGSGKTTLLLEIAERLLQHAEDSQLTPIPIVLSLSTWRRNRYDFSKWVARQLNQEYAVPKKTAQRWIKNGELLLLLDGLDEVAVDSRAACVEAINKYRLQTQTVLVPMVVCCRTEEYDRLPRLRLNAAVIIQPLTQQQISDYIEAGGGALTGLNSVLKEEPSLYRDLFSTPLMLNVAVLTYESRSAAELGRIAEPTTKLRDLWDAYIERMLERKQEARTTYDKSVVIHRLEWLGAHLTRNNLQTYLIEEMQPSDLPRRWQAFIVRWLLLFFVIGPFLPSLIDFWRRKILHSEVSDIFVGAIGFAILFVALLFWFYRPNIKLQPVRRLSLRRLREEWKSILIRMVKAIAMGIAKAALIGAVIGGVLGTIFGVIELFRPESGAFPMRLLKSIVMVPWGAIVIAIVLVFYSLAGNVAIEVFRGLFDERIVETTVRPNEGVHRSIRTALAVVIFGFVLGCLIGATAGGLVGMLEGATISGILLGALVGSMFVAFLVFVIVAPFLGGRAAFQHYVLRVLLWWSGEFPFKITRFLDWTTQRILVQRVGGGWQFVHRTLQERFAERYYENSSGPRRS